ncbi:hypothetical protein F511_43428 [Dorcoceras hygrometricum]|uniref:Cytochrome P450 n=1 Tax=Dorcoceras hygrometricum TaxID=472368 RepID=A0A2Z7A6D8_9LAMI|nr:hypothetical protein F511_43428 [Dorcoceras hygrometricum]
MIIAISFLLLSFSTFFLFNLLLKPKNPNKISRLPPGPKGLPLIGNLHEFDPVHPHVYLRELAKKYGPLMRMKFGSTNAIVISSARVAKLAFKDNDLAIANRPTLVGLEKHSYNGNDITFSKYNETWRELRKLSVVHLFSVKQVASFYPIRRDQVSRIIKDIINKSAKSEVINLSRAIFLLVNRIICRAGFGKNYEELEERRFDKVFKETQEIAGAFYFGDHFPLLGWIDKLNGMKSRIDKNFRTLDDFYQGLIDEHLDPNRPESKRGDILDLLIKLKQDQAAAVPLKWENIKGILMV